MLVTAFLPIVSVICDSCESDYVQKHISVFFILNITSMYKYTFLCMYV
jgi:hypothetical protein